jgi:hypothetical protein
MPPQRPQSNYSKRPIRRLRLPNFAPPRTKGLFEEYFYACLVVLFLVVAILTRAGGMGTYDALVVGLWVTGFTWFAGQLKGYFSQRANTKPGKKPGGSVKAPAWPKGPLPLPPGMKPMIGPQWPLKTGPGPVKPVRWPKPEPAVEGPLVQGQTAQGQTAQPPAAPGNQNKPGFIYERPTLPDRKPRLPANWPGQQNKKPKR